MEKINRIVIFTIDGFHSNAAYTRLIEEYKNKIILIVESQRYGGKYGSFLRQLKKNFLNSGLKFVNYLSLHFIYYKFFNYFFGLLNAILFKERKVYCLKELAERYNIPIIKTKEVKDKWVVDKIKEAEPDLIITSNFDQLLNKEIIDIPKYLAINIHTSLLPRNKGPFPALWSVINKDDIGVTIHYLIPRFDEGHILKQVKSNIRPKESVLGLDRRLLKLGADVAIEVVNEFEKGVIQSIPQGNNGFYCSYPSKLYIKRLKKMGVKLYTLKDFIKDFI
jgi:folate-dependent phosphoribosylglycinamide formyltransferase PurN